MTDLPTNKTATEADQIIKTVESILVPIAEKAIQAAVPTLALPVVKQIVDEIVQKSSDELTKLVETGVTFAVIDHQTGSEQSDMSDAVQEVEYAEKTGDQDAIKKAQKDFDEAQDALAVDDGVAQPQ